ncbi:hypothetical protein CAPTEDRAFT_209767 [Capitella teleta]|uniref:Uncharacterized protein n=1 Tax=Capitella teleta TaxID=283909 RepID=R7TZ96_CAPTE|nr:hypothetical protein CAPTEDRAFT_209767 [Capitella teleta]|eukprot:ELT96255.1 hypothetical protein CAPTEDRAFT_209767 [Capitella teleta]
MNSLPEIQNVKAVEGLVIGRRLASNRQYKRHLDWTPDITKPQRFATWKSEIQDEVLFFESEDKPPKYICNYMKVCSGERGKAILREIKIDNVNEVKSKQLIETVETMNIETNPKDKTQQNVLLIGLASKEIHTACLKVDSSQLDNKKVMKLAVNIESCNLMAEDLSDIAQ